MPRAERKFITERTKKLSARDIKDPIEYRCNYKFETAINRWKGMVEYYHEEVL
jgi:hypothetical protein